MLEGAAIHFYYLFDESHFQTSVLLIRDNGMYNRT